MLIPAEQQQAFWSKVKTGLAGECWPWQSEKNQKGYGRFRTGGRYITASRVAWSIHNKRDFPKGKLACHRCDNPSCCNPAHIWVGTARENTRDSIRKGRFVRIDQIRRNLDLNPTRSLPNGIEVCGKGHPRTEENTITYRDGSRQCKVCKNSMLKQKQQKIKLVPDLLKCAFIIVGLRGRSDIGAGLTQDDFDFASDVIARFQSIIEQ